MNNIVELLNLEKYNCCKLNLKTGEKFFCKGSEKVKGFSGLYFMDENNFFAIFPSEFGPIMYYKEELYPLNKNLNITLTKKGNLREFYIKEYNILIKYRTSPYIGFDVWSNEEDVDLFYQIEQSYKNEEYYNKFTK